MNNNFDQWTKMQQDMMKNWMDMMQNNGMDAMKNVNPFMNMQNMPKMPTIADIQEMFSMKPFSQWKPYMNVDTNPFLNMKNYPWLNMDMQSIMDMQKIMTNMQPFMNTYQSIQKAMMDNLSSMDLQDVFMNQQNIDQMQEMFNFYKNQQEAMELWNDYLKNSVSNNEFKMPAPSQIIPKAYRPMEVTKMMSRTASDIYEKMLNSNQFYFTLYKIWEELQKNVIKPNSENFKKDFEEAMKNYDRILLENFIPLLPEEIRGLFTNPYKYIKALTKTVQDFYDPWANVSDSIADIFAQGILTDPTRLSEILSEWKRGYQQTLGELADSPVIGNSRETVEQNNKMLDALIDFLIIVSEYVTKLVLVANDNSKKAFEEYFELIENDEAPETFNEFYKYWSSKVEDATEKYFYTHEFSNLIATTADAAMRLKIETDKATEKILANTPIVTTSDVDSVYKNVYNLKKEVKALKKELATLKKEAKVEDKATATTTKKDDKK